MNEDAKYTLAFSVIAFSITGLIIGLLYLVHKEEIKTQKWAATHHCVVVAKISGDVFNTVGFGGKNAIIGIGVTPDKIGYKCDDGVTYYK